MQKLYTCFRLHFSTNPAVFQYGPHPPTKPVAPAAESAGRSLRIRERPAPTRRRGPPNVCRRREERRTLRGRTNRTPSSRYSLTAGRRDRLAEGRGRPLLSANDRPPPVCGGLRSCRPPAYSRQRKNVPLCVFLDRLFLCACNNASKDQTFRFRTAHAYRAAAAAGPYGPAAAAARQTLGHPGAQTYEFAEALCRIQGKAALAARKMRRKVRRKTSLKSCLAV